MTATAPTTGTLAMTGRYDPDALPLAAGPLPFTGRDAEPAHGRLPAAPPAAS